MFVYEDLPLIKDVRLIESPYISPIFSVIGCRFVRDYEKKRPFLNTNNAPFISTYNTYLFHTGVNYNNI